MNKKLLNLTASKKILPAVFCVPVQILKKSGILNIHEQKACKKKCAKKIGNEENLA